MSKYNLNTLFSH